MNHSPVEAGAGGACGAGGSRVLSLSSSRIGAVPSFWASSHMEAAAAHSGGEGSKEKLFVFELRVLWFPLAAEGDL